MRPENFRTLRHYHSFKFTRMWVNNPFWLHPGFHRFKLEILQHSKREPPSMTALYPSGVSDALPLGPP